MDKKKIREILVALQCVTPGVTPETIPLIKEDEELSRIWNIYKGDVVYFYSILSPVCKDKFVEQLLRLFTDNNNKPNENTKTKRL